MPGEVVGYARVSTVDQDHSTQVDRLKQAGCVRVYEEKRSGNSVEGRSQLQACLDYVREGDTLVVTRIDRLARSLRDLQNLVHLLKGKGVALRATEQPIDTSTAAGKAFLDMLGVFAEFELNLRQERQLEGIAKAKAEGKYKGRQPVITQKLVDAIQAKLRVDPQYSRTKLAEELGVGRATVYRAIAQHPELSELTA